MRKTMMMLAVCLMLAGMLGVNGTFAMPDTAALGRWFEDLTAWIGGSLGAPAEDESEFDVSLVYLDGSQTPQLTPGAVIRRKIAVTNNAESDPAYFRLAVAVQASALDYLTAEVGGSGYAWTNDWRDIEIDGRAFKLKVGTYKAVLPVGNTSDAAELKVSMNVSVTNEQMAKIDADFLQVQAMAVDANAFDKDAGNNPIVADSGKTLAETVLDKALPLTDSFNPFN